MSASTQSLLDRLIGTVRYLYHDIEPLSAEREFPEEVYETIATMRTEELRDAQAIKEGLSGVPSIEITQDSPEMGGSAVREPFHTVLSQFGTARETTLSMVRELPEADWSKSMNDGSTIRDRIQVIVERDEKQLKRLYHLAGKSYPPAFEVHAG
jgi:hypothetical protein